MIPRNLRHIRLFRPSIPLHRPTAIRGSSPVATSLFHTSAPRRNELPKSPFQTFVDVLKEELRKNRELLDNVKQLQGDVDKLQDSEALKRAKSLYEKARVCFINHFLSYIDHSFFSQLTSSIQENPRLRAAAEELRKGGMKVSDAVSEALKSMEESEIMRHVILFFRSNLNIIEHILARFQKPPLPFPLRLEQPRSPSEIQLHIKNLKILCLMPLMIVEHPDMLVSKKKRLDELEGKRGWLKQERKADWHHVLRG